MNATPSTLDLLITNSTIPFNNLAVIDKLISDHKPILCQLNTSTVRVINNTYRYDLADWTKFRTNILGGNFMPTISTPDDIEESVTQLTEIICTARAETIPVSTHREKLYRIAPDTHNAIKYRNELTRKWQRCANAAEKSSIKSSINIISRLIKELIYRDRNSKWHEFMNKIDGNPKKLWRVSRSLRGKRGSTPNVVRHGDQKLITNDEKAEAFAEIFEKAHRITSDTTHPHDATVNRFTARFGNNGPHNEFPL